MYALTIVGFPLVSTVPVLFGLDSPAATVPYRAGVAGLVLGILFGWPVRLTVVLWVLLVARMFYDTLVNPLRGDFGMPAEQILLLSLGACFLSVLVLLETASDATLGLATAVLNPISVGHRGVSVFIVALSVLLFRMALLAAVIAAVVLAINYLEEEGYISLIERFSETLEDVQAQERIAMATGVVGGGLLLANLGAAILASIRLISASPSVAWISLMFLQWVVNGMVSGSLYLDGAFWAYGFGALIVARSLEPAAA